MLRGVLLSLNPFFIREYVLAKVGYKKTKDCPS